MHSLEQSYRDALGNEDFEQAARLARDVPLGFGGDGRTALYVAAAAGAYDAAAILLERGEDPLAVDAADPSLAAKACHAACTPLLAVLLERGVVPASELPALFRAVLAVFRGASRERAERGIETLGLLLEHGLDLSQADPPLGSLARGLGTGLLARVDQALHASILERPLASGLALDTMFEGHGDALCQAARTWEEPSLREFLFAHGANPMGTDGRGTVLHGLASRATPRAEVELWLSRGARLEARDEWGRTPLLAAAHAVQLENARLFADLGANVLATDAEGRNARALVADRPDADAWSAWLDERGADAKTGPAAPPAGPAHAAVPANARKVRVVQGAFKGMDAFVTPRGDGGLDAVINVFGRGLTQVLAASDVEIIER